MQQRHPAPVHSSIFPIRRYPQQRQAVPLLLPAAVGLAMPSRCSQVARIAFSLLLIVRSQQRLMRKTAHAMTTAYCRRTKAKNGGDVDRNPNHIVTTVALGF